MAYLKTLFRTVATAAVTAFVLAASFSAASAGPNCTCRFAGQNYKTGDIMCIRGKLSRCEFVLNNTSWKTVAETCPQTMGPKLQQTPANDRKITVLARMQARLAIK